MKKLAVIVGAILLSSFFVPPRTDRFLFAEGASLGFSPESGSYAVGKTFNVRVIVASGGQAINAAEGVATFDNTKLTVTKLAKTNSVFSLWAVEPSYSNTNGTVTFGGGNTSSYTGNGGTVVTITFKVTAKGSAALAFSSGAVLAADGKGTNVLGTTGRATYTLTDAVEEPAAKPTPTPLAVATPIPTPSPTPVPIPAPEISSPTHPDETVWYANASPEFTWVIPPDVVGVGVSITEEVAADPGEVGTGLIETQGFKSIPDGVWYVHVKFKGKDGQVAISHRRAQIDATPPKPFAVEVHQEDPTDPRPRLTFSAMDETSGMAHYEIVIGDAEPLKRTIADLRREMLEKTGEEPRAPFPFYMPVQAAGPHAVVVRAVDRAGNATETVKEVAIEAIDAPKFSYVPTKVWEGEVLYLEGATLQDSTVHLRIAKGDEKPTEEVVKTGGRIQWSYARTKAEIGSYAFSAKAVDRRGAESPYSDPVIVEVVKAPLIARFGWIAVGLLAAGLVVFGVLWKRGRKTLEERLAVARRELAEMREHMKNVFDALNEEVDEKVHLLMEKPSLTAADHVLEILRGDLDTSQELIEKEIQDVDKALRP